MLAPSRAEPTGDFAALLARSNRCAVRKGSAKVAVHGQIAKLMIAVVVVRAKHAFRARLRLRLGLQSSARPREFLSAMQLCVRARKMLRADFSSLGYTEGKAHPLFPAARRSEKS